MADRLFADLTDAAPLDPRPPAVIPTPTVESLYALFPDQSDRPRYMPVRGDEMPEPYRSLLVHTHHMTVTVERFYGDAVDVRVLEVARAGDEYARKILLTLHGSGKVVQLGIVQIDLSLLGDRVREQIVDGKTPLGRVLIQNNVLRHIQPAGYFRVEPSVELDRLFGRNDRQPTYGRLGVIFTDGKPAIEVLEILAAVPSTQYTAHRSES
jgi:chorismate-pyruvate lyase